MSHLHVSSTTETAAWKMSTQGVIDGPAAQYQNKEEHILKQALHTLAAVKYSKGKPPRHLCLDLTVG